MRVFSIATGLDMFAGQGKDPVERGRVTVQETTRQAPGKEERMGGFGPTEGGITGCLGCRKVSVRCEL